MGNVINHAIDHRCTTAQHVRYSGSQHETGPPVHQSQLKCLSFELVKEDIHTLHRISVLAASHRTH